MQQPKGVPSVAGKGVATSYVLVIAFILFTVFDVITTPMNTPAWLSHVLSSSSTIFPVPSSSSASLLPFSSYILLKAKPFVSTATVGPTEASVVSAAHTTTQTSETSSASKPEVELPNIMVAPRRRYGSQATQLQENVTESAVGNFRSVNAITKGDGGTSSPRNPEGIQEEPWETTNSGKMASGVGERRKEKCDIYDGKWVRDDSFPLYPAASCPFVDKSVSCVTNGRPERLYEKWRWQPHGCRIPRLDGKDMLERLRGKHVVFVGDSLGRNMWKSLLCVLWQAVQDKKKIVGVRRPPGSTAYGLLDYNCTVEFFWSPFLVEELKTPLPNGSIKATLRLDTIAAVAPRYQHADILIFNSGHWFTPSKTNDGKNYYQVGEHVYETMEHVGAYRIALNTWAKWVDANVNPKKTKVFFRGYSSKHYRAGQWNTGGRCHNEVEPITNDTHLEPYPEKMRVVDSLLGEMKTPISCLNVTKMTAYRKDGHPSFYRKQKEKMSEEETRKPEKFEDCIHWCLPGIPDTWNELLYAKLVMT